MNLWRIETAAYSRLVDYFHLRAEVGCIVWHENDTNFLLDRLPGLVLAVVGGVLVGEPQIALFGRSVLNVNVLDVAEGVRDLRQILVCSILLEVVCGHTIV